MLSGAHTANLNFTFDGCVSRWQQKRLQLLQKPPQQRYRLEQLGWEVAAAGPRTCCIRRVQSPAACLTCSKISSWASGVIRVSRMCIWAELRLPKPACLRPLHMRGACRVKPQWIDGELSHHSHEQHSRGKAQQCEHTGRCPYGACCPCRLLDWMWKLKTKIFYDPEAQNPFLQS